MKIDASALAAVNSSRIDGVVTAAQFDRFPYTYVTS